jgi:hypothetical protein
MKLNDRLKRVPAAFAAETRFAVVIQPAAPFRATLEDDLERLKDRLLRQLLSVAPQPELNTALRRAANDAAAIAWTSGAPLLVFPELLREKADAAHRYAARQAALLQRSRSGMESAA